MNTLASFEIRAEAFRKHTGMIAPGKDKPFAYQNSHYLDSEVKARWDAWNKEYSHLIECILAAVETFDSRPPEEYSIPDDAVRLDWLEHFMKCFPEHILFFNDDKDIERDGKFVPVGFTIGTDGCHGTDQVTKPTLREAIDKASDPCL